MALLRPDAYFRSLHDIDPGALQARGIAGLIVDLDNTLAGWRDPLPSAAALAWVDRCRAHGLRLVIVSNNQAGRVSQFAAALGVPFLANAKKPTRGAFRRALGLLQTTPERTALIGDQLLTDIFGAKRMGFYAILVKPLDPREFIGTRLVSRPLERLLLRWYRQKPL